MATEYDLFHHPQLNPAIQQKIANSVQRVAKICWRMCNKDNIVPAECIQNCTKNYVKAYDIVLDQLKNISETQQNNS